MLRLFQFLKRYHYPLLFLLLQALAFSFIINNLHYHKSVFFHSFQEVRGFFYNASAKTTKYFALREMNDSLLLENARLKAELYTTYKKVKPDSSIEDSVKDVRYNLKPAYVVNNSIDKRNNHLTLDAGTKKGLNTRMGVITTEGIAGIIKYVSPNYALAISVLSSDFKVNARIVENGEIGSVTWDGRYPNRVVLKDIPSHIDVKTGQKVVVGPYSNFFPENTPIGRVSSYELVSGGNFYNIYLELFTDIKNIRMVYVIEKNNIVEQKQLEEKGND
jgi:rod shape-determining protein MreC